jgi:hypothetical protein
VNPRSFDQATRSAAAKTISNQRGVGAEGVARQVSQPGGLQLADAVLDASVLAVSQLQAGELTGDDTGSTFAYLHPEAQNTARKIRANVLRSIRISGQ